MGEGMKKTLRERGTAKTHAALLIDATVTVIAFRWRAMKVRILPGRGEGDVMVVIRVGVGMIVVSTGAATQLV